MSPMSPALPGESSRLIDDDNNNGDNDTDTVGDLSLPVDQQRHLMEIESSFHIDSDAGHKRYGDLAAATPSATALPNRLPPHQEESDIDTSIAAAGDHGLGGQLTVAGGRARASSTAAIVGQISSPASEDIKDLEYMPSSPTAAAHARSMSRAATAASALAEMMRSHEDGEQSLRASEIGLALERQPSVASSHGGGGGRDYGALAEARPPSAATNPRPSSARPIPNSTSSSTLNQAASTASSSYKRRPKILRSSRNTSQRSSISSVNDMQGADDDESTLTMGEERQPLSRQTSLGSIASGITALGANGSVCGGERTASMASAADRALARLDEEERNSLRGSVDEADLTLTADDKERPFTPKERAPPLQQPTETAVTAQVKNVRVPPTIAREFSRHLGAPGSPSKKAVAAAGTPAAGRGREMTLKEQTASIDRLQKENFDLKIKVYYLQEKLAKESEEGVKEALQENVDLKVKLAESMREKKAMKKRLKDLEKMVEELGGEKQREEEASAAAESEEIWELKERVEHYEIEIEEYKRRDAERNERMREFRRQATNGHQASEEQLEQLRDLLASETARREAQEAENLHLREEMYRMRSSTPHLPRTTLSRTSNSRSISEHDRSQSRAERNLQADLTQARQEIEELRREVSAQASMLTSRNREKDRLYAEIEDLKLTMRGGGSGAAFESASRAPSVFSDRLLDRSVSRAGGIQSAAGTHVSSVAVTETEREEFEDTNGALRDRISELRIANQDLEQRLEACYAEIEQRQQELTTYEDELDLAQQELQDMQADRNDALRQREATEQDFDQLKQEAEDEIQRLEEELGRFEEENRLKDEDFRGLQQELRNVSDVVVRMEDLQEVHQGETRRLEERIRELERTIHENEQEMNVLENALREANEKNERMVVQGESSKGEIQFLREEQDGDKIKIGQLESTIKQLQKMLEDEQDKVREARQQLGAERQQREQHGGVEQREWERRFSEKTVELTHTKDEIRRLKHKVSTREDEAKTWRERLEELERGLREALGDLGGTRTGLMQSVHNLQQELDATLEELDYTKGELTEKDRNLKDRESLLESMALETRKLSDLLEKERNLHRHDKHTLETLQSTTTQHTRKITQHQQQTSEIEKQRHKDAKTLKALEEQFREQLAERNTLLTQVWQRLSAVCGADWATRNSLVTTAAPSSPVTAGKISMEAALVSAFPGFAKNLLSAVKTIESIVAGFKTKCRSVERDLWKEYQAVENALDQRTKRIERLEGLVRGGMGESSSQIRSKMAKLRAENRLLKVEIDVLKQEGAGAASPPGTAAAAASNSGNGSSTPGATQGQPAQAAQVKRSHTVHPSSSQSGTASPNKDHPHRPLDVVRTDSAGSTGSDGGEKRWILRLRELEKRLKQEREARLLDRSMANKKIQESRGEKEEIKKQLERERVRSEK